MLKISTPGKDDGSVLLDVVVSLTIITLVLFPLFSSYLTLSKVEDKQDKKLERIIETQNQSPSWYWNRSANEG